MSTIRLTDTQAAVASQAYQQLDSARRLTRNYAHSTGQEVVDSFRGTATTRVEFNQPSTSVATVSFDPQQPVQTVFHKDTLEHGYDPANQGTAMVSVDYNNTHSLSTLLTPHTHDHYLLSPGTEHLSSRTGTHSLTVDVDQNGTWIIQERHFGFMERFEMFSQTSVGTPSPIFGEG